MDILFSSIVAGLLFGMVLAMVALGLTIIFGVMDIVNFAHGEFLMIGMYTGLLTAQATGCLPCRWQPWWDFYWELFATPDLSNFCSEAL